MYRGRALSCRQAEIKDDLRPWQYGAIPSPGTTRSRHGFVSKEIYFAVACNLGLNLLLSLPQLLKLRINFLESLSQSLFPTGNGGALAAGKVVAMGFHGTFKGAIIAVRGHYV